MPPENEYSCSALILKHGFHVPQVILIGDSGTGKSCLLQSFLKQRIGQVSHHTVGVEFGAKTVQVGGKVARLQIWDTAGQERFKAVTRSYYRGAASAIIVYDIANRSSFDHVATWLVEAKELSCSEGLVTALVGNKSDLGEQRQVTFVEGSCLAQEHEMLFLEASALSSDSVEEIFLKVARSVLVRLDEKLLDVSNVAMLSPASLSLKAPTKPMSPSIYDCC